MHNAFNHTQFSTQGLTATFNAAGANTNAGLRQYTAARGLTKHQTCSTTSHIWYIICILWLGVA